MFVSCQIVRSAFGRDIVIPLVKNTDGNIADSSNYRGITFSPIISKIFECLMMDMVKDKLISSDLVASLARHTRPTWWMGLLGHGP